MFKRKQYCRCIQTGVLLLVSVVSASVMALDDPTQPPFHSSSSMPVIESENEAVPELVLSSILISPDRRVAVINGQILKRDELIMDARVVTIEPGRVLLDNAGKKIELFLLSDVKKVSGISKL